MVKHMLDPVGHFDREQKSCRIRDCSKGDRYGLWSGMGWELEAKNLVFIFCLEGFAVEGGVLRCVPQMDNDPGKVANVLAFNAGGGELVEVRGYMEVCDLSGGDKDARRGGAAWFGVEVEEQGAGGGSDLEGAGFGEVRVEEVEEVAWKCERSGGAVESRRNQKRSTA